ncbi:aminoacyl-tRNA hydrolase [Breznakiellaceae bacterium SP9]
MLSPLKLVAFLGNHGREYAANRHNAGRLFAAKLPFYTEVRWQQKFKGRYAACNLETVGTVHLLMPETYMNKSGDSVFAAAQFFTIKSEEILVVHDELELALGTASFKFAGGLGGHNGLRSMKANFDTADFWRLRFGIGRPAHPDIADWVLSDFTETEKTILERVFELTAAAFLDALVKGPQTLLPEWNKKKLV